MSSTLAWKIPWTEEPGRYSPWGREQSDTTERLHFHFSLSCIGEGNDNPLQCSCLENPRDREWLPSIGSHSQTRLKRLSSSSRLSVKCPEVLILYRVPEVIYTIIKIDHELQFQDFLCILTPLLITSIATTQAPSLAKLFRQLLEWLDVIPAPDIHTPVQSLPLEYVWDLVSYF